jgi:hypothetical protein
VRLIFAGKKLDETMLLTDYDLKHDSTVHAIISLLHLQSTKVEDIIPDEPLPTFPSDTTIDDIYTQTLYNDMLEDDRENLIYGDVE